MARISDNLRRPSMALPAIALAGLTLAACATGPRHETRPLTTPGAGGQKVGKPYQINGVWYTPRHQPGYDETGIGSWYGEQFHNRHTASGEVFDMDQPSAAHTTLPLPSLVEVTNLDNGRRMVVRVNDRGPFVSGRIIDLSRAAARELGYQRQGTARVRVRYLGPASANGTDARTWVASAPPARPPRQVAAAPTPSVPQYLPDIRPPRRAAGSYRIQAGAFADLDRAERAVEILAAAGRTEILPLERDGLVLYRVQVAGVGEPFAAREQVAALGYPDARILPSD